MGDLKFDEVQLQTINLLPGDVLSVKLVGDDFDIDTMESLRQHLTTVFPLNKVMVFTMPTKSDIKFEVIRTDPPAQNYCNDCNCGKKEEANG